MANRSTFENIQERAYYLWLNDPDKFATADKYWLEAELIENNLVYTYKNNQKVDLIQDRSSFIVKSKKGLIPGYGKNFTKVCDQYYKYSSSEASLAVDIQNVKDLGFTALPTYCYASTMAPFIVTDKLFVEFLPTVDKNVRKLFAEKYGLKKVQKIEKRVYIYKLRRETTKSPVKIVTSITESKKNKDIIKFVNNVVATCSC